VRIETVAELRAWIAQDLSRYPFSPLRSLVQMPQTRWQILLRVTEYINNRYGGPVGVAARWWLQSRGIRLGYTIPINRFGPGLMLPHWGTIVVNGAAEVGVNCTLHVNTVLANRDGAPRLGDNVVVCAGAYAEGPITIGDNAYIAPHSVVRSDVRAGDVVGGAPARSLHPHRFEEPAAG
jgi:serine O-acetyltransferase